MSPCNLKIIKALGNPETPATPEIKKCLEDYKKAEDVLNELFGLDNFCFNKCISTKVSLYPLVQEAFWQFPSIEGCCTKNYSKLRLNIPISNDMREKFKQMQGESPYREKDGCPFHCETGCQMKQFKSPICLAYICPTFKNYLKETYDIDYSFLKIRDGFEKILFGTYASGEAKIFIAEIQAMIDVIKKKLLYLQLQTLK
jgi:hypothetical protein